MRRSGSARRRRCAGAGAGRDAAAALRLASASSAASACHLRRRAGGLQFGEHRAGFDHGRGGRGEIAGIPDHLDRTVTGWNLGIAKVTEKPASGAGTVDRAGGLAARSERGGGVGPRRGRFELDLDRRRRRLEGIEGKRGAAGKARSGDGNRDDTTHDRSLYCGKPPQSPLANHRSARTELQPRAAKSLKDG